jgi:DNA-directed RNA polymerase subunit RPC12/RpoP
MYYFSSRRAKKIGIQQKKTEEQESNTHFARLFGFIMILTGLGSSFAPSVGDITVWGRIFFILFGLAFVLTPNKNLSEIKLLRGFYKKNGENQTLGNDMPEERLHHCLNCGNKLITQANFCNQCGNKIIVEEDMGEQTSPKKRQLPQGVKIFLYILLIITFAITMQARKQYIAGFFPGIIHAGIFLYLFNLVRQR